MRGFRRENSRVEEVRVNRFDCISEIMPKRAFPFQNCAPLQLKTHVENKHVNNDEHKRQIYEKTQSLLKAGAKALSQKENNFSTVCQNCQNIGPVASLSTCSFCDKKVCEYCFNVCFSCEQNFCFLCSVISYDDREEKSYCLSCSG